MNSFKTTKMFHVLDKIFEITQKLASINKWVNKYSIDRDKYDYLIQILKTYKYPLTKDVVTALEKGEVVPINTNDPKNPDDKMITIPTSITSLSTLNEKKKLVTYVDTSSRATYVRNKVTNEIEAYAINPRDFFIYAYRGYIARYLIENKNGMEVKINFVKAVCDAYSRMLVKTISAIYATGAKEEWGQRLRYITICFALQNFFNFEPQKAKDYALTFKGIDKSFIYSSCKYYNSSYSNISMRSDDVTKENKQITDDTIFPFDIYISILAKEFEEMRSGKIERRTITDRYISMYGQNAITALEHCESFINMIMTSELKSGLYIDNNIHDITKDDVKVIISTML